MPCKTVTVEAPGGSGEASIHVVGMTLKSNSTTYNPGDSVDAVVDYENTGDATGRVAHSVSVNGHVVGSASAVLEGGESGQGSVTFSVPDKDSMGVILGGTGISSTYSIDRGGDGGNGGGSGEASIHVVGMTLQSNSTTYNPGDSLDAVVDYENTGDATGQAAHAVYVNGYKVGSTSVSLEGGESGPGSVTFSVPDKDSMTVVLGGTDISSTYSVERGSDGGNGGDDVGNGGDGGGGTGDGAMEIFGMPITEKTAIAGASVIGAGSLYAIFSGDDGGKEGGGK